jgi:hypothetical protein
MTAVSSTLDEDKWSASHPPLSFPGTQQIGDRVNPTTASLEMKVKRKILALSQTLSSSS